MHWLGYTNVPHIIGRWLGYHDEGNYLWRDGDYAITYIYHSVCNAFSYSSIGHNMELIKTDNCRVECLKV